MPPRGATWYSRCTYRIEAGVDHIYTEEYRGRDKLAHDFFTFLTAGVNTPINSVSELSFEFQYEFSQNGCRLGPGRINLRAGLVRPMAAVES